MSLGFKSCLADPDVWMRPAIKPDGSTNYEYLLAHVDDILVFSTAPLLIMDQIGKLYRLKEGSQGKPSKYLGADVVEYYLPDDKSKPRWAFSSAQYVGEAIQTVELELTKSNNYLSTTARTPFSSGYRPELDVTHLLDDK